MAGHGPNGAAALGVASVVDAPERHEAASEAARSGDGNIVVTLPDGTTMRLIGATRLLLALSDPTHDKDGPAAKALSQFEPLKSAR